MQDDRLVQVNTTNKIIALAADITDFEGSLEPDFALNAEVPFLRGRTLEIRVNSEDRAEIESGKSIALSESTRDAESWSG